MSDEKREKSEQRLEIEERLADVVEGSVSEELLDFIAEDEEARDLVYDAERAVELTQAAAADYDFEAQAFEQRLLDALDVRLAQGEKESVAAAQQESAERGSPPAGEGPDRSGESKVEGEPRPKVEASKSAGSADDGSGASLGERLGRRGRLWAVIGGAVAAAAAAAIAMTDGARGPSSGGPAWTGTVAAVSRAVDGDVGLERCSAGGSECRGVEEGAPISAGSMLRTGNGSRALIQLDDGTELVLDRGTELTLSSEGGRRAALHDGGVVADVAKRAGDNAIFEVPLGYAEVVGTKFALRTGPDWASLDVSRGAVRLADRNDREVMVFAGEHGELYPDAPPSVTSATSLGDAMGWSESSFGEPDGNDAVVPGLGELRAKKPGEKEERSGAVALTRHSVRVRINGAIARTEIEEVFENQTDEVLEGIYRFPLPAGAQIERLALEVDGKLEEGAFVDRERAAAIWRGAIVNSAKKKPEITEEIVWVPGPWKDPALLEWQRGGRFELRIFPIPKRGSRRVVLAYTQTIPPTGDVRRYTYPLPYDPGGSTKVGHFDVSVEVRGHDRDFGVRPRGYSMQSGRSGPVAELSMSQEGFVPTGDLSLEYALPNRGAELSAWAYEPGSGSSVSGLPARAPGDDALQVASVKSGSANSADPYVAIALRPKLPRRAERGRRTFALAVDASRSMIGERYRRAALLAARIVREADRMDRITVLACDTECRQMPGGAAAPGPEQADAALRFLDSITPEGGSDVAAAVRFAKETAAEVRHGETRIVYIGDGTPTVGPVQPAFLRREIEQALPSGAGRLIAVAIGADSDLASLETIAEAGGGVALPYSPGQRVTDAAYAVLGAAYGSALRDASVELPEGLGEVAPRRLGTIIAGGERYLVARMTRPSISGKLKLSGKVGGESFDQTYPLELRASTSKGNAFVPRLFAAKTIAELEKETGAAHNRERIVQLSKRFHVASRYTSLLVLESPAMFRAFDLDNTRRVAVWTGEEDAEGTNATGEIDQYGDSIDEDFGAGSAMPRRRFAVRRRSAVGRTVAPKKKAPVRDKPVGDKGLGRMIPGAAAPAPEPAPPASRSAEIAEGSGAFDLQREQPLSMPPSDPLPPRRRWVPMRKVWERTGSIDPSARVPKAASAEALAEAERAADESSLSREAVKRLYSLYFAAGRLDEAERVAQRWSKKDPLDPDALTARADLAAARGQRDLAIRILGSVVDVRPGDHKAQWRLARLHRWAGRPRMGCRFSMAVSQIRPNDARLLAEAVRCARNVGDGRLAGDLLSAADEETRREAEIFLEKDPGDPNELRGDLRLEAKWEGGDDLDLAMVHPDGHRVSWLGAPTRSVITARDVLSTSREGLALRGAKPGQYVLEVTRVSPGAGTTRGTVHVTVGKKKREIPFTLQGQTTRIGVAKIRMRSKLVPVR